jgi:hypothetical protein
MRHRLWPAAPLVACALVLTFAVAAVAQDMPHEKVLYDCTRCHQNINDRSDIAFDHSQVDFDLEGQHTTVTCARCHDLADFSRADETCASCHTDVHQGRLYPECETCHSPERWDVIDAYGAHSRTAFQLMGAHIKLDCDSCHEREIVAERSMLTSDCFECHRQDYEATDAPPHVDFGYPTNCEECHIQLAWRPTILRDHPGFPIFSGTHAGEWDSCLDCHGSTGSWLPFSCLGCHRHNEAAMDDTHDDVVGYSYNSFACYGCHPTGSAEGGD